MIREYNKNDIDAIIRLLDVHNELSESEAKEKRKELEEGAKVLVYEDEGEVKGICSYMFWKNSELGSCAEIIMSVEKGNGFKEAANSLWEGVQGPLKEKEVVFLMTNYEERQNHWRDFYSEKQFEQWFGIDGMVYNGGKKQETKLSFRNYEENDFETYYTYLGQCFSIMREANDIRPYDIFKNSSQERIEKLKKQTLDIKDDVYLFYDKEKFVGSSIIKEEIDDLFVVPKYQGQGYGRKIMEASINLALERNYEKITLGVVVWNKPAINLYESLGFEKYQGFEHRRLIINKVK